MPGVTDDARGADGPFVVPAAWEPLGLLLHRLALRAVHGAGAPPRALSLSPSTCGCCCARPSLPGRRQHPSPHQHPSISWKYQPRPHPVPVVPRRATWTVVGTHQQPATRWLFVLALPALQPRRPSASHPHPLYSIFTSLLPDSIGNISAFLPRPAWAVTASLPPPPPSQLPETLNC